jgi:hypothetical protein
MQEDAFITGRIIAFSKEAAIIISPFHLPIIRKWLLNLIKIILPWRE